VTAIIEILGSPFALFLALPWDTQGFLVIIVAFAILFHMRYSPRTVALGPTLLTTAGIFATFFGIARGLSQFNTTDIQASIPSLLGGLKTAFWASVFGVGAALTLKLREFVFGVGGNAEEEVAAEDVTAADLVRHLRDIRDALTGSDDGSIISQLKLARQDTNQRLAPLADIQRGLLGGEDGSLLTQVRLLRQDNNDRLDALRAAQTEALQKLSEMGSAALVEALRDVIRDFNDKITEQFGENFRHLNAAVGQLLVWQEQYKQTIENTVTRLDEVVRLVGVVSGDFEVLVERSGRFAQVADDLGRLLTALTAGEQRLKDVAEGLAALLISASGNLPEIERKVAELTSQMADSIRDNQRVVGAALAESAEAMRTTIGSVHQSITDANTYQVRQRAEMAAQVERQMTALAAQLAAMVTENQKTVSTSLAENAAAIRTSVQAVQQDMTTANADFNRQLTSLASATKDQVAILDRALSEELTNRLLKNPQSATNSSFPGWSF